MFTGGSTSKEKVVKIRHCQFANEALAYPELLPMGDADARPRVFLNTDLFWAASAIGQISMALALGGTIIPTSKPASDIEGQLRAAGDGRVNVIGVAP